MNAVGREATRIVKIPIWESELWSYVSLSDGEHCPLYDSCRTKRTGDFCPCDNAGHLKQLLDAKEFNASDYYFLRNAKPDRILKLAAKLANKYLKKGKVKCPPVPSELVSLIDETHPIEVRLVPLKACHGATWHFKDSWVIQLNENDPPALRRFTLFHEAFHIIAHNRDPSGLISRGASRGSFYEVLAECFSVSILMPCAWVRRKWAEVNDLGTMAEIFDVPKPMMYIQLKLQNLII